MNLGDVMPPAFKTNTNSAYLRAGRCHADSVLAERARTNEMMDRFSVERETASTIQQNTVGLSP